MNKRSKTPLDSARTQVNKQLKAVQEASLPAEQKQQIVYWLTGLERVMGQVSQAVDHTNPPPAGDVHAILIGIGRNECQLGDILGGAPAEPETADVGI